MYSQFTGSSKENVLEVRQCMYVFMYVCMYFLFSFKHALHYIV